MIGGNVAENRSIGHGPKSGNSKYESTILVDATLKQSAPPLALPAREFMERSLGIWKELGLPAITPQAPWHGYSLGDWADDWEANARRAVKGDWEVNGQNTLARRRGGVTPETPVRDVE